MKYFHFQCGFLVCCFSLNLHKYLAEENQEIHLNLLKYLMNLLFSNSSFRPPTKKSNSCGISPWSIFEKLFSRSLSSKSFFFPSYSAIFLLASGKSLDNSSEKIISSGSGNLSSAFIISSIVFSALSVKDVTGLL